MEAVYHTVGEGRMQRLRDALFIKIVNLCGNVYRYLALITACNAVEDILFFSIVTVEFVV